MSICIANEKQLDFLFVHLQLIIFRVSIFFPCEIYR